MGTQQILLIVLGVIIVGIAAVVGISIFGTNAQQSNADAVLSDCLRIATGAQAWCGKPSMLGGGNYSFNSLTLQKCGWQSASNENGTYQLSQVSHDHVYIVGMGKQNVSVTLVAYRDSVAAPVILTQAMEVHEN